MQTQKIKITFLGTGTSSGIPMICCPCEVCHSSNAKDTRLRSSILVESATTTIVIDTTPDFRYQMLRINNKKLDAVLFTHAHKDHIAGLDDVRAYNYFQEKEMQLYATEPTIIALKREFAYAFADEKYPGIPDLALNIIHHNQPFIVGDIHITPVQVWHHKMPVLAFRINGFTYITDANRIEETEEEKIAGTTTLVINALRKEPHISHFTLDEAIAISKKLKVKRTYLTHISHQLGLHDVINNELPKNVQLAYDGLVIEV